MIIANDLKPGTYFQYEGNVYNTLTLTLNKTAMRQMVVKIHAKDMRTGTIKDVVFTGGEKVEEAEVIKSEMQYLYDAGDELVFMDTASYDQVEIPKSKLEWEMNFLKPNDTVDITSFQGEILGVSLDDKVALEVTECEQAVKGDTATSALKNAVLETGWEVKVPLFIETGEQILVTTSDGKYAGRA